MNKMICVVSLLLCLTLPAYAQQGAKVSKLHGTEYIVEMPDGLDLHGWFTPSPFEKAPLFVMLPMMGYTHTSYNPLIKAIYERFKTPDSSIKSAVLPHMLCLDMRGHGESTSMGDKTISYRTMEPEDFQSYPTDVETMINHVLRENNLQQQKPAIVIVGASIGANTAIMAAELVGDVTKVVMLSPGESYRSLEPAPALINFKGKTLIYAAEEDGYSRSSSEKLAALNKTHCLLKIYPGPFHGTDILENNPEASSFLVDWLLR